MQNLFSQAKILPVSTNKLLQTVEFIYTGLKASQNVSHVTDDLRTNVSGIRSLLTITIYVVHYFVRKDSKRMILYEKT
jgi:hypothetical protein